MGVASFGLLEARPLDGGQLNVAGWHALVARASKERMEGILAAAVSAGALEVTDSQLDRLREVTRSRARADLLLERETVRAAGLLEAAGVPYRVLKGPAWAHTAYPDPMWRGFGDVDILVLPARWYDALEALEASGARRLFPELRPDFDGRFGKDATFVARSGWEIDLHRTLVLGPYGFWVDCDELLSRSPAFVSLGGTSVAVLDPDAAFVHACYNAALADDPPRVAALRDVAQMAIAGSVDPGETFSLAQRWKGVGVVRRALAITESALGSALHDTPIARRFAGKASTRDRMLMATYRGPGRGYTSQLAGVVALPGLRAKAAYLSALARPQRAYLDARGFSASGFLEHAIRRVGQPR
jgi:hypothetical protein